jgi:hypothetical protein
MHVRDFQKLIEAEVLASVDYGVVEIVGGQFVGRIGYFDDEDEDGKAIVYFEGHPIDATGYDLVPMRHVRRAPKCIEMEWHMRHDPIPPLDGPPN